jgi:ATP-dependent Clp protease ATP-binding subunit ClpA
MGNGEHPSIFIDEIHCLIGAGSAGGNRSNARQHHQAAALSRGEVQCIGATGLPKNNHRHIEPGPLPGSTIPVHQNLRRPARRRTVRILFGITERYENVSST